MILKKLIGCVFCIALITGIFSGCTIGDKTVENEILDEETDFYEELTANAWEINSERCMYAYFIDTNSLMIVRTDRNELAEYSYTVKDNNTTIVVTGISEAVKGQEMEMTEIILSEDNFKFIQNGDREQNWGACDSMTSKT